MKKRIAVGLMIVALLLCSCGTNPAKQDDKEVNLGVRFEAVNVSPEGITLVVTHNPGAPIREILYGNSYWLQRDHDGKWEDVTPVSPETAYIWTSEAHALNRSGTTNIGINWKMRFGELPSGHYRIGKILTAQLEGMREVSETFYVEFDIP